MIEIRDSLLKAYHTDAETSISQYSVQERQIIKELKRNMLREIEAWNRKIALADPNINATGSNKVDFRNFRYGESA